MTPIKGESRDEMYEPFDSKKPMMPTIRLTLKDLPEAKDWEVGKTYTVELELKMTGLHMEGKKGYATFEAQEIEVEPEDEEAGEDEESGESEEKPTFTRK